MFTQAYTVARVAGIPIRVHVTLLALMPLVMIQYPPERWGLGLAAAGCVLASIVLHELGHALVALRTGLRVREIVMLPIGGVAAIERMPAGARGEIAIAAAGPAVSFLLALALGAADPILARSGFPALAVLADFASRANYLLALFNLIPSFPMDGGRIFRAVLAPFLGRLLATRLAAFVGRAFAVVIGLAALFAHPLNWLNLALAVFLFQTASAEVRQVMEDEMSRFAGRPGPGAPFGPTAGGIRDVTDEIEVSPPPYERGRTGGLAGRWKRWLEDRRRGR